MKNTIYGLLTALVHGPVVFARDSRYADGDVDECCVIDAEKATLAEAPADSFAWLVLIVPAVMGTDLENPANATPKELKLCDFSSAGNDWKADGRYRVWLPRKLHVMHEPYTHY